MASNATIYSNSAGAREIINRVTFINFFDLFNLDLSISGDNDIKWKSDIFHDSRTISKL